MEPTWLVVFAAFAALCVSANPSVVLIVVDDLRPALGCYGDRVAITPNLDALAGSSILFDKAYAQQALCGPSRTSFLTSHRPDTLRIYNNHRLHFRTNSHTNFTTLPQYFRKHGYVTAAMGKVFHPTSTFTDDMPFSWTEQPFHPASDRFKNAPVCHHHSRALLCPVDVSQQPLGTLPDLEIANRASRFLQRNHSSPFFLAVGFNKPHIPFRIPQHFLDWYPLSSIPDSPPKMQQPIHMPPYAWEAWNDLRQRDDLKQLNVSYPFGPVPELFSKKIRQHYYASVSYIDQLIGLLLKDMPDDVIVAVVGDHGWLLGEHQEWSKYSNFEDSLRVPWIVRLPPTRRPLRIEEPVELLDLFPTLVDVAGLPVPPDCRLHPDSTSSLCVEGKSLKPLLESSRREFRLFLSFSQYPRSSKFPSVNSLQPDVSEMRYMGYSVRTRRYRFTDWIMFDRKRMAPQWDKVLASELYDFLVDPDERRNVAADPEYRLRKKALRKLLRAQKAYYGSAPSCHVDLDTEYGAYDDH